MGMFDRDPNFGEKFTPGDRFILCGIKYEGEIQTVHGTAKRSTVKIVTRDETDKKPISYTALGDGFALQAQRVATGDLPAVVEYVKIPIGNDREVKRFEPVGIGPQEWFDGNDGPALVMAEAGSSEEAPAF